MEWVGLLVVQETSQGTSPTEDAATPVCVRVSYFNKLLIFRRLLLYPFVDVGDFEELSNFAC